MYIKPIDFVKEHLAGATGNFLMNEYREKNNGASQVRAHARIMHIAR